jgi:hypothetical protein
MRPQPFSSPFFLIHYSLIALPSDNTWSELQTISLSMVLRLFGHWTGGQPAARPLPIRRSTQTQNKRTQTSMPLNWQWMQHTNGENTALLLCRNQCAWSCPWQGQVERACRPLKPLNIISSCYDNTRILIDPALPCCSKLEDESALGTKEENYISPFKMGEPSVNLETRIRRSIFCNICVRTGGWIRCWEPKAKWM